DLKLAKSNRKQDGDGEDLALEALDILPGEVEAALYFVLNRRIALVEDHTDTYGFFKLEKYDFKDEKTQILEISNQFSLVRYQCTALDPAPGKSELTYTLSLRDMRNGEIQSHFIDTEDIPPRMRDDLFKQIDNGICRLESSEIKRISREIHHYASLAKATPYLPMGSLYQENIGSCLRAMKSLFRYGTMPLWDEYKESFITLIGFYVKYTRPTDRDIIQRLFDAEMAYLAEKIQALGLYDKNIRFILEFLQIVREHSFQPDLTQMQNAVYPFLSQKKKAHKDTDIGLINTLGKALNFDISIN
ncbi:MAG TPA: glycoside hydrolase, partial [Sphaerochaeta sp.]|nr:glycoside hydrolase [Sphaerochaeta sp.]